MEEEKGGGLERGVAGDREEKEKEDGEEEQETKAGKKVPRMASPLPLVLRSRAQWSSKIAEETVWDGYVGFLTSNSNTDIVLTEVGCSCSHSDVCAPTPNKIFLFSWY